MLYRPDYRCGQCANGLTANYSLITDIMVQCLIPYMDINSNYSKTKQFATTLNCQQLTQAVMYNYQLLLALQPYTYQFC